MKVIHFIQQRLQALRNSIEELPVKNIFPEEIEEYLSEIETIAECVVVGRKAEDSDEIILTAIVYPNFEKLPAGSTEELMHEAIDDIIFGGGGNGIGFTTLDKADRRQGRADIFAPAFFAVPRGSENGQRTVVFQTVKRFVAVQYACTGDIF